LTQRQCLEATVDREKKIDVAAGYILLYEVSRKGSLVSEAIKALSFSRVRGHLGNASGARIWLSKCNADALVPQVDEGDNAGEWAGRGGGSDGSDHGEPAALAWCAPLGSAPDAISSGKHLAFRDCRSPERFQTRSW
jgi:hypothetical protein